MVWNTEEEEAFNEILRSIAEEINELSLDYQNIWESLGEEMEVCKGMVLQHVFLSARFHEFHTIWGGKWDEIEDPESERAVALTAVHQEGVNIHHILTIYEDSTGEAVCQLMDFSKKLKQTVDSLSLAQVQVQHSTSVEELEAFDPLEFDIASYNTFCAHITDLNRQWGEDDLNQRFNHCLEKLLEI